ncbi:MAG: HEAT repeat domain-containing protein [Lentisphaerae bacterium]|nr:HEAT repeat domain-containing protein [Lentisphaerota bacterium]
MLQRVEVCDIVFVLTELLETSESSDLRTMGAIGLRRTKSPDAVEPLIAALSDKEESVRKAASQGLKEITGMDFGADAQQYQTWWSANKDRLAENAPE